MTSDDQSNTEMGPMGQAIRTLTERRDYLTERIKAKEKVGWCREYDTRERDATTIILEIEILKDQPDEKP